MMKMNCFCGMVDRRKALFPAGTIIGGPHQRESPTHREHDLTCAEPEFRLSWMTLCSGENHYTPVSHSQVLIFCDFQDAINVLKFVKMGVEKFPSSTRFSDKVLLISTNLFQMLTLTLTFSSLFAFVFRSICKHSNSPGKSWPYNALCPQNSQTSVTNLEKNAARFLTHVWLFCWH